MTKILKRSQLSENVFRMTLEAPLIARERKAGQFIILRTNAEWGERIPLTIADADPVAGTIDIIFQTVGASTKELATFNVGDSIADLVGPLGKPTEITNYSEGQGLGEKGQGSRAKGEGARDEGLGSGDEGLGSGDEGLGSGDEGLGSGDEGQGSRDKGEGPGEKGQGPRDEGLGSGDVGRGDANSQASTYNPQPKKGWVVVVGGGIGVAPAHPIAQAFKAAGNRVTAIMGARTKELIIMEDEMRKACDEVVIVTDDGSYGRKGLVTEPLKEFCAMEPKPDEVVIVGPPIMMKFAALATKPFGVKTIASLNSIMIDGTGMCGGCRVTVGGKTKFVCVDGPEFDAHQVDFDNFIKRLGTFKPEEAEHKCRSGIFG